MAVAAASIIAGISHSLNFQTTSNGSEEEMEEDEDKICLIEALIVSIY